jgi:hypothetical protein
MKDALQIKLRELKKELSTGGEFFDIGKCLDLTKQVEKLYRIAKKSMLPPRPSMFRKPTLYMVKTFSNHSSDRPDQRVGEYLGFVSKKSKLICLYTRGEALKKARLFNGKAEKFKGTPNKKKHLFV